MNYKKYSLYNFIGAMIWGSGLTAIGYLVGHIPPVARFITDYIDVILLAAVVATAVPTIYHYVQSSIKAKRTAAAAPAAAAPAAAGDITLDPDAFNQHHEH
jgi:membrane-associated protein